ncbi:MAG: hemolysin family protein [Gemmatimonadales bacterium]
MIETLHHLLTPFATFCFALWAAWLSFAAEADTEVPRILADQQTGVGGRLPPARALYAGHLFLLVLAGAAAGTAETWWEWAPLGATLRLLLAVVLVWVVASLLPRLLAAVAPDLPPLVRPAALRSLRVFAPLLALVARADNRIRPPSPAINRESGPARRDMLLGLFSLADMTVAEVMTPRIDIIAVDTAATVDEVVGTLRRSEHARILVFDGHPDAVVGVLYAKDMVASLSTGQEAGEWQAFIRPAAFVPEGKTLDRQLRDFQRGPSHLAVVVDEFGGTAGLITLEDILEEVVGEIQDEHDTDEVPPILEDAEGRLSVEGGVPLAELEALLGHHFQREDLATVGGLALDLFGRVPRSGERTEVDGYELVAEQVARRRVRRVLITRPAPLQAEPEEGAG